MKHLILAAALLVSSISVFSQKIDAFKATVDGDKVILTYQLQGEFPEQTFNVKLFSSNNKFSAALQYLEGDANRSNITPGSRQIIWDAKKELGEYEGELHFKIVASVASQFTVNSPTAGAVYKRGRKYPITWEGFNPRALVTIELYENGKIIETIDTDLSGNTYEWEVSKKAKPGRQVYIRVVDSRNRNLYAQSGYFKVKRIIPLGATLSTTGLILGGAAYWFLKPTVYDPLPLPPDPEK